jgi:hypothetical protein
VTTETAAAAAGTGTARDDAGIEIGVNERPGFLAALPLTSSRSCS